PGVTRDAVIKICQRLGLQVLERAIPREMLYLVDEAFFTGTATEIAPIRSIDRMPVGTGARGKITELIQNDFYGIISGEREDELGCLTPVGVAKSASRA